MPLTEAEIEDLINRFVIAAKTAQEAEIGRTELHRNGMRGVPYVPLPGAGEAAAAGTAWRA